MHESLRTNCRRHTRTVNEAASSAGKNNVPEIVRYKCTTTGNNNNNIRDQLYKIGLPGKSILGDYFQENMTSRRPFLLLRISFPGRPIFIQLPQPVGRLPLPHHAQGPLQADDRRVPGQHPAALQHDHAQLLRPRDGLLGHADRHG